MMKVESKLSPEYHAEIFKQEIESTKLATSEPVGSGDQLTAIFFAGQPGAGKGGLSTVAATMLPMEKAILIDIDALRPFHPRYMEWQENPATEKIAAELTQPDAGAWGRELFASAIDNKRHIVFDSTLANTKGTEKQISALKEAGYQIVVLAMAVQPEVSHLGVLYRFEEGKKNNDPRWVPEHIEKLAYEGLPKTLHAIEQTQENHKASVQVYDRDIRKLFDNHETVEKNAEISSAVHALVSERQRPLNAKEIETYARQWNSVIDTMKQRQAPEHEILEATRLAQQMRDSSETLNAKTDMKMDTSTDILSMPITPASRFLQNTKESFSPSVTQGAGQKLK